MIALNPIIAIAMPLIIILFINMLGLESTNASNYGRPLNHTIQLAAKI